MPDSLLWAMRWKVIYQKESICSTPQSRMQCGNEGRIANSIINYSSQLSRNR